MRLFAAALTVLVTMSAGGTGRAESATPKSHRPAATSKPASRGPLLVVPKARFLVFQRDGYAYDVSLGAHQGRPRRIVKIGETGFGAALTKSHIYWITMPRARPDRENIMAATRRGTHVHTFIPRIGQGETVFVAGHYLYWDGTRAIGRARLNGTHVDRRFIVLPDQKPAGAYGPENGLATDGQYLYFVRCSDGVVGRVPLAVKRRYTTIPWKLQTRSQCPQNLAVAGGYIYWDAGSIDVGGGDIGRASIARGSSSSQPHWVRTHTVGGPMDVTGTRQYVFWDWPDGPNGDPSYIARVRANGTHPRRKVLTSIHR
jgi:hypothetical protein